MRVLRKSLKEVKNRSKIGHFNFSRTSIGCKADYKCTSYGCTVSEGHECSKLGLWTSVRHPSNIQGTIRKQFNECTIMYILWVPLKDRNVQETFNTETLELSRDIHNMSSLKYINVQNWAFGLP